MNLANNMKKYLTILALCLTLGVSAQVKWPAGAASGYTMAVAGTTSITVINSNTYMSSIPTLTANATIHVTASSELKAGAILLVAVKTTSTETTTFAGSIVAPVVTGVAGKTWTQAFIYNGTNFYPCGAKIQVD